MRTREVRRRRASPNAPRVRWSSLRVGFFTECYKPIVNGVVASIDALRDGLGARGVEVTTIAPHFPRFVDDARDVVRIPSLPLPTQTAYRLCVPYLNADDRRARARHRSRARALAVRDRLDGGASYARSKRIPLVFTYHTRLDAYAHYAPFDRGTTERAMVELTRRYANAADAVVVPTRAMEIRLRELGVHAPIAVVPSAIDVERFAAGRRSALVRARLGASDDAPLALVVSRLGVEKNVELALDALARLPALRLAVVGEGPHRAALEERARAAGRGRAGALRRRAGARAAARRLRLGRRVRLPLDDRHAGAGAGRGAGGRAAGGRRRERGLARRAGRGRAGSCRPTRPRWRPRFPPRLAAGRDQSAVHLAFSRYTVEMQTRRILELYREVLAARAADLTRTYVRYRMIARAMTKTTTARHRSADVAVGYASDRSGNGIAYAAIATGSGRAVVKVPFRAQPLRRARRARGGYAAVAAVGAYLRGRGFTRVRLRVADAKARRGPQRAQPGPAGARDGLREDPLRAARLRAGPRRTCRAD